MTKDEIRGLMAGPGEEAPGLIRRMAGLPAEVGGMDLTVYLSGLVRCRAPGWQAAGVKEMARDARIPNRALRLAVELLADVEGTKAGSGRGVEELLAAVDAGEAAPGAWLAELLLQLHRQGRVDARELLVKRLGWGTGRGMWAVAIRVLLVCAPEELSGGRLGKQARQRGPETRVLLRLCLGDPKRPRAEGLEKRVWWRGWFGRDRQVDWTDEFRAGVWELTQMADKAHRALVLQLASIWRQRGERERSQAALVELGRLGDERDCVYLISI